MDFSQLWWVSQWWVFQELQKEENYGHGLYVRKRARNLPFREETAKQHEEHYWLLMDLHTYKTMNEDKHPPLWTIAPRWEQELAYDQWESYQNWLENRAFDKR